MKNGNIYEETIMTSALKDFFRACMAIEKNNADGTELINSMLDPEALELYRLYCEKSPDEEEKMPAGLDPDPKNWTRQQLDDVAARVRRGERIVL